MGDWCYHGRRGRQMPQEDCRICTNPANTGDTAVTPLCAAREPSTGRNCDLDRGHAGPHLSITEGSTLAWGIDPPEAQR